jgi:hydroxyacyl-ACP dehydratase HTD2-like protein with hotdog domain
MRGLWWELPVHLEADSTFYLGRTMLDTDTISAEIVRRYAATLGRAAPVDGALPPLWHYGFFCR